MGKYNLYVMYSYTEFNLTSGDSANQLRLHAVIEKKNILIFFIFIKCVLTTCMVWREYFLVMWSCVHFLRDFHTHTILVPRESVQKMNTRFSKLVFSRIEGTVKRIETVIFYYILYLPYLTYLENIN
jgi:hypothetical protein